MISHGSPALVLAPMDGITDAAMREYQGGLRVFSFSVSEFIRVSSHVMPKHVFIRDVPELAHGGKTVDGMPVYVQILGGDPARMAQSAVNACKAGALAIDINFGCPAPTVNRNDGGASLLRTPCRIREVVRAVREAVPDAIPVSAKLRLGWDSIDDIHENSAMAAEGGASWLTIHARTRTQGYAPPVYWPQIRRVRERLGIPLIANGDIWTLDDFHQCREETGSEHFMIGRGALANPALPFQIGGELGLWKSAIPSVEWATLLRQFVAVSSRYDLFPAKRTLARSKQWLALAAKFGDFTGFDGVKRATSIEELLESLEPVVA